MIGLLVRYNTSLNPRWPQAYSVHFCETDERATGVLRSSFPVTDNVLILKGIYPTRREAVRAVLDYIATPCQLVELTAWGTDVSHVRVCSLNERAPGGHEAKCLGRNSRGVQWIAE